MERRKLRLGATYRHFKGGEYWVLCVAMHTDTNEPLVVYVSKDTDKVWARPFREFMSEVDHVKYPTATQKYRFELKEKSNE